MMLKGILHREEKYSHKGIGKNKSHQTVDKQTGIRKESKTIKTIKRWNLYMTSDYNPECKWPYLSN